MSDHTGFRSFHIYNVVKYMYYRRQNKMNLVGQRYFPKRDVYLKKWNEEMVNRRDSMIYLNLDKRFDNDQLVRLMSYYWLGCDKFFVTQFFDEDFATFKRYEWEIVNIKDVLEKDFLFVYTWSLKRKIPLKKIFKTKSYSPLFKMYEAKKISVHSLICFNKVFDICTDESDRMDIVQKEKLKKYRLIFDNYAKLIYNYLDFDIKGFLKNLYNNF